MFLQAAGLDSADVRSLAEGLDTAGLTTRQRILVACAEKITRSPRSFSRQDAGLLQQALPNEGDRLEAASVMSSFNFANRCADALGVPQEVPRIVQNWPWARWTLMGAFSWYMRGHIDLKNRQVRKAVTEELLDVLETDLSAAGFGKASTFFRKLSGRPDLLAVQVLATQSVLIKSEIPYEVRLCLLYLISSLNGDTEQERESGNLLTTRGMNLLPLDKIASGKDNNLGLSPGDSKILSFARDVTLCAYAITDQQVAGLRHVGLSDSRILDLVAVCAAVNANNRLTRLLAPEIVQ